jgi:hypothetical protein
MDQIVVDDGGANQIIIEDGDTNWKHDEEEDLQSGSVETERESQTKRDRASAHSSTVMTRVGLDRWLHHARKP